MLAWGKTMYQTIFTNLRVVREIYESRKETNAAGAAVWNSIKVGDEEVIYNVAVDPDVLATMGRHAARNKSQQCKDGAVLVEVVTRKRL